jgi:hypothetical protein
VLVNLVLRSTIEMAIDQTVQVVESLDVSRVASAVLWIDLYLIRSQA